MSVFGLPDWATEELEVGRVARLAYLDADGQPRVLPITYALAQDAIWSVIDRKPKVQDVPARVEWLRREPRAGICVDVYHEDWTKLAWVQLIGEVDVLELDEDGAGLEALLDKYPQYHEEAPQGPLLRLSVERGMSWRAGDQLG
jgi:PPOX class probable F420-dependent enzyme